MPHLLVGDVAPELMRRIEDSARARKRSLSREVKALLASALSASMRRDAPVEKGLGSKLRSLVSPEDWTDDFIQPRDKNPPPRTP